MDFNFFFFFVRKTNQNNYWASNSNYSDVGVHAITVTFSTTVIYYKGRITSKGHRWQAKVSHFERSLLLWWCHAAILSLPGEKLAWLISSGRVICPQTCSRAWLHRHFSQPAAAAAAAPGGSDTWMPPFTWSQQRGEKGGGVPKKKEKDIKQEEQSGLCRVQVRMFGLKRRGRGLTSGSLFITLRLYQTPDKDAGGGRGGGWCGEALYSSRVTA